MRFQRLSMAEVLGLVAGAEARSDHPLAQAVVRAVRAEKIAPAPVQEVEALAGFGLRAETAQGDVLIGAPRLMAREGVDVAPLAEAVTAAEAAGHTMGLVAIDGLPTNPAVDAMLTTCDLLVERLDRTA